MPGGPPAMPSQPCTLRPTAANRQPPRVPANCRPDHPVAGGPLRGRRRERHRSHPRRPAGRCPSPRSARRARTSPGCRPPTCSSTRCWRWPRWPRTTSSSTSGSGDGRLVIAAARLGARAIGVELAPNLVALAERRAAEAGVADRTGFVAADLFDFDLSPATVVTMFLLPDINYRLRPALFDLRPGTRIVSNTWDLRGSETDPDAPGWAADATVVLDPCPTWCTSLLWIVPRQGGRRLAHGRRRAGTRAALPGVVRRTPDRGRDRLDLWRAPPGRGDRLRGRRRLLHRPRRRRDHERHRPNAGRGHRVARRAGLSRAAHAATAGLPGRGHRVARRPGLSRAAHGGAARPRGVVLLITLV